MKKLFLLLLFVLLFPAAVYAEDSVFPDQDTKAIEDSSTEEVAIQDEPEAMEEEAIADASSEITENTEDCSVEFFPEESVDPDWLDVKTDEAIEEDVIIIEPEVSDAEPAEPEDSDFAEDNDMSLFELACQHVQKTNSGAVDVSSLKISSNQAEAFAMYLSSYYDEFYLIEENGCIVSVSFEEEILQEGSETDSDYQEVVSPVETTNSIYEEETPYFELAGLEVLNETDNSSSKAEIKAAVECQVSIGKEKDLSGSEEGARNASGSVIGTMLLAVYAIKQIISFLI